MCQIQCLPKLMGSLGFFSLRFLSLEYTHWKHIIPVSGRFCNVSGASVLMGCSVLQNSPALTSGHCLLSGPLLWPCLLYPWTCKWTSKSLYKTGIMSMSLFGCSFFIHTFPGIICIFLYIVKKNVFLHQSVLLHPSKLILLIPFWLFWRILKSWASSCFPVQCSACFLLWLLPPLCGLSIRIAVNFLPLQLQPNSCICAHLNPVWPTTS